MDLTSTYEYVVSPKAQRSWRVRRVLMIVAYVVYTVGAFVLGSISGLLVPMLALVPLSTWIIVFFTWRYVSVEYEYSLTGGVMTLTYVYGGRSRKVAAEIRIKEASMIAPFDGEYIKRAEAYTPEETLDFTADLQHPDVYCLLYETEEERRGIVYFEATERALKILRYYNPSTVVRRVEK